MTTFLAAAAGIAAALLAAPALAHTGHPEGAGFVHGVLHPLGGIDHLLAMVAVGLWAARQGGRAVLLLPAAFVVMLVGGAALGMAGVALPAVEAAIAASVAVLGLLALLNRRLPLAAGMALVGAFAVFHGHAHGAEMPAGADALGYGLGFVAATVLLHAAGVVTALAGRLALRRAARA
ncbi:HupE/UreJ family protein [Azospirillum sp. ST 5-10]|uniref:HupE/UreJ family protein n=1 Tax=unclassified Azospirillum TaxID=2630922 RepID=UPI003F49D0E2